MTMHCRAKQYTIACEDSDGKTVYSIDRKLYMSTIDDLVKIKEKIALILKNRNTLKLFGLKIDPINDKLERWCSYDRFLILACCVEDIYSVLRMYGLYKYFKFEIRAENYDEYISSGEKELIARFDICVLSKAELKKKIDPTFYTKKEIEHIEMLINQELFISLLKKDEVISQHLQKVLEVHTDNLQQEQSTVKQIQILLQKHDTDQFQVLNTVIKTI